MSKFTPNPLFSVRFSKVIKFFQSTSAVICFHRRRALLPPSLLPPPHISPSLCLSISVLQISAAVTVAQIATVYVELAVICGGDFWSVGLRALYFTTALLLCFFGPIPMFASSVMMAVFFNYLDSDTASM